MGVGASMADGPLCCRSGDGAPERRRRAAARVVRLVIVAGLAAWLAACATSPPSTSTSSGSLSNAPSIPLAGRLAIRVDAANGVDAKQASVRFELQGSEQAGRLNLATPVGTTLAEARWQPNSVDLVTAEGSRRFATLDALSRELLGEALPIVAVLDWLRGRPWDGAPHRRWPGDGAAAGFDQLGWRVDLSRFDVQAVTFSREQPAPKVDVRVRLDPPNP